MILVGTGVKVWGEINVPAGVGTRVPVGVEIEGWVGVQCGAGVQSGVMAVNSFVNPDVDVTFSIPN
jgi:formylmethanofuran dehydrogenase subunit C